MVEYICNRCKIIFNKKSTYTNHKNKKKPCKVKCEITECDVCGAIFKHKTSLYKHKKENCKGYKIIKKNKTPQSKEIADLRNEVEKLKNMILSQSNNNTINNTQNNNTQNIDKSQNIVINVDLGKYKINKFGEEDLSHITTETFKKILGKGLKSVPELIQIVNFDKDHPQNHNVLVTNLRSKNAKVHNGEKWETRDLDDIANQLVENNTARAIEVYEKLEPELNRTTKKKFTNFMDRQDDDDIVDDLDKCTKKISYDNNDIVKNTCKKIKELEKKAIKI